MRNQPSLAIVNRVDLIRFHCGRIVAAAFVLIAGCGGNENGTYPVTGKVTWEGQPVTEGTVTFLSLEQGRPASGTIQPDGTYSLHSFSDNDGAKPGQYSVEIKAIDTSAFSNIEPLTVEQEVELMKQGKQLPTFGGKRTKTKWLVPEKYSEAITSELIENVEPKNNEINFELP